MTDITDAVTDRVITNGSMDGDAARAERRRLPRIHRSALIDVGMPNEQMPSYLGR